MAGIDGGGWLLRCSAIRSLLNMVVIQNSVQMGSDPSLAISQIAVEVDQLAIDAFHNLVFLSVELA